MTREKRPARPPDHLVMSAAERHALWGSSMLSPPGVDIRSDVDTKVVSTV